MGVSHCRYVFKRGPLFSKEGWGINISMERPALKGKWLVIGVLALGFFLFLNGSPSHAQKSPKTLTLVYSNNINGEIDPCPT
jgi:hypothetical protein